MIGVYLQNEEERESAAEFFELFKTPWEFYREGESYDVLLSTRECPPLHREKLVILYGSGPFQFDSIHGLTVDSLRGGCILHDGYLDVPLYGEAASFPSSDTSLLKVKGCERSAALVFDAGPRKVLRIGYNLFGEIRHLLTIGQPPEHAAIPSLDHHIALLRKWILEAGIPVMEIPPAPSGSDFMVCLTHDVDFAAIRNHRFDHTLAGFLHRALVGTAIDFLKGRSRWRKVLTNWKAALQLPAVYTGLMKDPWTRYAEYLKIEKRMKSTFYFIPFRNRPGNGKSPARRSCRYDISDVSAWTAPILSQGGEIGLHGIDAWNDVSRGKEELERIRQATGTNEVGVRMHWLYFGQESPGILEEAGFLYDSTWGYNDAVGFRAGTGQPFRPSGARRLLELPLIIQDTALFYKGRMGLDEDEALELCRAAIDKARRFGGVLVVNWHHRSLAPERLWGDFYRKLLGEIGKKRVLFVTAREAVDWFHERRSAVFIRNGSGVRVSFHGNGRPSRLALRVYDPQSLCLDSDVLHKVCGRTAEASMERNALWGSYN
ncbi:MAG: hypothetical protein PHS17_07275 [Desulfobacterales bacterium]|nr:hypothetical protein [Desulfobacterales bacterium]